MIQLFVSDDGFIKVYGMKLGTELLNTVKLFCKEAGVPKIVIVDSRSNKTSDKVRQLVHKVDTTLRVLKDSTQHSFRVEMCIGLITKSVGRDICEANSPMKLWCLSVERRATIMILTAVRLIVNLWDNGNVC